MVITTTPLMDQSKSGPIISFLTFDEPSSHFCGDGAGAVWHFHNTDVFLPSPAPAPPRIRVVVVHGEGGANGWCPGFSLINLGSHSGMAGIKSNIAHQGY